MAYTPPDAHHPPTPPLTQVAYKGPVDSVLLDLLLTTYDLRLTTYYLLLTTYYLLLTTYTGGLQGPRRRGAARFLRRTPLRVHVRAYTRIHGMRTCPMPTPTPLLPRPISP